MKRLLFSALFVAWAGPCPAPPIPVCPDCVSDTFDNGPLSATGEPLASGEYVTSGDFNGDGRLDVLLLDKATGLWRRGSEDALGPGFTFDQARPSGLEHVTGLAAGYFRQEGITAVAACSASTNRLHFILNGAASLNADAQPHEVTLPAAGPSALAAVDVPTVGTTTLPELTVATEAGVGTNLQRHVLGMTQTGGEFLNSSTPVNQRVLRLAPILIGDGTHVLGALLVDGTMSHRFELWQPAAGNFNTASAVLNPLVGARFISGFFDGDHADVLFYTEGSSTVRASRISLNTSNQPVPSPLQSHLLARTLRALYPLKRGAATEALALYTDGTAAVLDYAQGSGFSTVSSIDLANVPMPITGALPLPTGDFLMLTGDPADPSAGTTHAHRFNYDAATGGSRLVWTGALPAARLSSAAGNVLVFTADPLSDPNARLVRVAHVRDWTRNLSWPDQPGLKDLSLHAESYLNRNAGLGNPQPTTLPWFVGNGQFALGNQTTEAISMFTFDATLGERLDEVIVDPAPGSYDRAVHVMLRTRDPNMTLLYRKNGYDAFGAFPPGGLWLYGDATLEYFGSSNGQLTPRKSADFRFTRSAKEQDADGDGVPDFVEVAYGLDPEGSLTGEGTPTDFDGDGWSDLNEILAGANPGGPGVPGLADPAQHPAPNWLPPPTSQQFKLWVKPRGVQPAGTQAVAGPGTVVEAHDTTGTFLAKASMISYNDGSRWAHLAVPDTGDAQRIILLSTPPHFLPGPEPWPEPEPSTWPEKEPSGRELLGYVRIPPVTPLAFDFTFNPLEDPTAQAQAWVNARRAATGGARTEPVVELSYLSTLKVLLLERILRDLGPMRGLMFSGSLTPFRDTTSIYTAPGITPEQIATLENAPSYWSSPSDIRAWKFAALLDTVDDWVAHPTPALATIKEVAFQVYRISSDLNNAHPGVYAPPATVLRRYIQHQTMDSAYLPHFTGLSETEIASAPITFYSLTFAIPKRPVLDVMGTAYTHSSIDSSRYSVFNSSGTLYNLLNPNAAPYQWPGSFGLTPGSQLRVIAFNDAGTANQRANLEVIKASIETPVLANAPDSDGNLLPDGWELFYLGDMGFDALGNADGSAYSLLQEYLQGTDPTRSADSPTSPPVDLRVQHFALDWPAHQPNASVRWSFPAGFSDAFQFTLQTSPNLSSFTDNTFTALEDPPGSYSLTFPKPALPRGFYRVVTRLR